MFKNLITSKDSFYFCSLREIILLESKLNILNYQYENTEIYIRKYLEAETQLQLEKELNVIDLSNLDEDDYEAITQSFMHSDRLMEESKDMLSHFIVVATFSFYEKSLKNILYIAQDSITKKITNDEIRNCFKESGAKKLIKKHFKIEYNTLIDFDQVEKELRYLNNDIKHSGKVSPKLTKVNSRWVLGNEIDCNIYKDFERLKDAPYNLLFDLLNKIKTRIQSY